ncbi:MAG: ABC transporter ATP-binding protein [Cytophagaceae bacterium]|nr:ABC transporter ATP-binding protein [Gemmatimonadaceae bacterium]
MIEARGLVRRFGERTVVDHVSFSLRPGEVCALLGPNGAGKTTTVRMLLGLIRPSEGSATVAGVSVPGPAEDHARLRGMVGLLTETPGFYDRLTALENLLLFGRLYGIPQPLLLKRIEGHLTSLGLWERRDDMVATYSKGMKQKLALVRAIFHEPDVIFFDEPTAGLDPESARVVRQLIASLKRAGRTIVLCTHNLAEAAELADVVGVLRSRLLAFGPPDTLGRAAQAPLCHVVLTAPAEGALRVVRQMEGVLQVEPAGPRLAITVRDADVVPRVVTALAAAGFGIRDVRLHERTLEDVYLEAVGADA